MKTLRNCFLMLAPLALAVSARDALDASTAPETHKDYTIFGVGFTLNF